MKVWASPVRPSGPLEPVSVSTARTDLLAVGIIFGGSAAATVDRVVNVVTNPAHSKPIASAISWGIVTGVSWVGTKVARNQLSAARQRETGTGR